MKIGMKIVIKSIPHKEQRYDTVGDYWVDADGTWQFRISKMPKKYILLVAVHELIEKILCDDREILDEVITQFDMAFERRRKPGNFDEPGDDINAPYFKEHQLATAIEKRLALELNVKWKNYEQYINEL